MAEPEMLEGEAAMERIRHWPAVERFIAEARAEGAAAERERIYAPDNFPGDGSVGPDEIPAEYRHLSAAFWHRRWLWVMNRLDEALTPCQSYDDGYAAGRAAERARWLTFAHDHADDSEPCCLRGAAQWIREEGDDG